MRLRFALLPRGKRPPRPPVKEIRPRRRGHGRGHPAAALDQCELTPPASPMSSESHDSHTHHGARPSHSRRRRGTDPRQASAERHEESIQDLPRLLRGAHGIGQPPHADTVAASATSRPRPWPRSAKGSPSAGIGPRPPMLRISDQYEAPSGDWSSARHRRRWPRRHVHGPRRMEKAAPASGSSLPIAGIVKSPQLNGSSVRPT